MNRLNLLIVAALALVLGACERHTWEDVDKNGDGTIGLNEAGTKRLYEAPHGEGSEGGDSGEGGAEQKPEEDN